jgi:two-component system OmpR family response regulator
MALRVLIVDDSRDDAELTEFALREAGLAVECRSLWREDALAAALEGFVPQLVLCDLNMPGWSGPEAMAAVRRQAPGARCVFFTGALPPGCDGIPEAEVVLKDQPARLVELARALECGTPHA